MNKYYREPAGETFSQIEEEVLSLWRDEGLLQRIREKMSDGGPLVFCEGPPTANTPPAPGHALARAVKDAFLRYHIMSGRMIVPYIAGWDCHGLPVELEVERALGLNSRIDIEAHGIEEFNSSCRDSISRYRTDWEEMSRRIGYWIDYDNAYLTMSNEYMESVWWSLKQLHAQGLLQKSRQVVPYCPRCGTALSTHEVALGFKEAETRFIIARFPMEDSNASLLVYTETPWTLVANALVAVDQDRDYVLAEDDGQRFIVSAERFRDLLPDAKELEMLKGTSLLGRRYVPPFRMKGISGDAFRIVHYTEISRDEGTGVMHISPPYGSIDYEIARAEGVSMEDVTDGAGKFTDGVPEVAGRTFTDAVSEVMRMLESRDLLHRWGLLKRSVAFCWRCEEPLMYKLMDAWIVRTGSARDRMQKLNQQIRWAPSWFREERFDNFVSEAKDWVVGRSRYWGTPLPVWRCSGGHEVCVGSLEELQKLAISPVSSDFDMHRPFVDHVRLKCPECGGEMRREEHVLDCWYDSGCAPFAQYHYPFENMETFDTHRSVDFISESVDQTRGWFYTQHALSTLLFDTPAFMSVLVTGNVLDASGNKMTKLTEGAVSPSELFSKVGADASRLYLLGTPVWQSNQFSFDNVKQTMTSVLTTLLNLYAFYASNANSYGYSGQRSRERTHDLDRWIISRLNSTVRDAKAGFDRMEVHSAVRAMHEFVEDLSNWYVRRSRRRFWLENDPQDRFSAHSTLFECLLTLTKIMAPITPFLSDRLYRNLQGPKGCVHLESFPEVEEDSIAPSLEEHMALVRQAVEAGRLARQNADIKLRQPLSRAVVAAGRDGSWVLRRYEKMISEELNVKTVECLDSRETMIEYSVSANLRSLGPKLKEGATEVIRLLGMVDGDELARHLRTKGRVRLGGYDLAEEDVLVIERQKSGFSHASVGDVHVYVSLEMDKKLKMEGLAREVIRRIQHMRKEMGLSYDDSVAVEYSGDPEIEAAVSAHKIHIQHETHAENLTRNPNLVEPRRWTVNKKQFDIAIRRS